MAMSISGNLSTPTLTGEGTLLNIRRSWLQCRIDRSYPGRRCIIATASETTTDLRTLSCGPEGSNLPELESAISLMRQFGSYASTHLKSFPNSYLGHAAIGTRDHQTLDF
jgi:hypothetical protein